jgi:hypothetical protein
LWRTLTHEDQNLQFIKQENGLHLDGLPSRLG